MAVDHADLGIRVNSLCPGPIETDLLRDVIAASENPEGLLADFERRILLNRLGRVEEVAAAALFLASDQASFVTGSTLVVDGGWTAH
jgi:NAD(P)-dependent dehydrogenase (short-subunit alcohol dehydrogenase family)